MVHRGETRDRASSGRDGQDATAVKRCAGDGYQAPRTGLQVFNDGERLFRSVYPVSQIKSGNRVWLPIELAIHHLDLQSFVRERHYL